MSPKDVLRILILIDISWLCINKRALARQFGRENFPISYAKLVEAIQEKVGIIFGHQNSVVLQTHAFGSYPHNYDPEDELLAQDRIKFFNMLETKNGFNVHMFPVNFYGKRLSKQNRPGDDFSPSEKCVDVALATELMEQLWAGTFDVAVVVAGDRDFVPPIQKVLESGKEVVLATIYQACSNVYYDHNDPIFHTVEGIRVLKLEEFAHEFFHEPKNEFVLIKDGAVVCSNLPEGTKVGKIQHIASRGTFGFISAIVHGTQLDFHFDKNSIANGTPFEKFTPQTTVAFMVAGIPEQRQAGHAVQVRILNE